MRRFPTWGGCTLLLLIASFATARAEDTRRKWQFGLGFSYWSTDDNIRSNASTAFAPVDPTQAGNLPSIVFSDPRPDANELNEPTVQDDFKLDFNASFGVTRFFALEIGLGYFKGDVGNIEFYSEDRGRPVSLTPTFTDPSGGRDCSAGNCLQMTPAGDEVRVRNGFVPVGKITEAPISLSGLVRFRPESPFDPYVGAGVGYIFASLDTAASEIGTPIVITASDETGSNQIVTMAGFDDVQDFTNGLKVLNIRSGARAILTYPCHQTPSGCITDPARPPGGAAIRPLTATVEDGLEYHLRGGVDYYFNEHWSIYIDGRYLWAQSRVKVRIDDQTQIAAGIQDHGCVNGARTCRTINGGELDISNSIIVNDTADDIQDLILIQGGDIRLGGFSLGIGAKVTF